MVLTAWSSVVVGLHRILSHYGYRFVLPLEPLNLMGIAVAFYLGFKNEKAYTRYWEARTLWGGIVNYSRTWANSVIGFLNPPAGTPKSELDSEMKVLIYRHIGWLYALALHLRKRAPASPDLSEYPKSLAQGHTEQHQFEPALRDYLAPDELPDVLSKANIPAQIIRLQSEHLRRLSLDKGWLDAYRHTSIQRVLEEYNNLQGACERIKNTPLPRQYAHTSHTFVVTFCLLLPLGLLGPVGSTQLLEDLLTIPISVLVGWTFLISEKVGDTSEDPFENFMHDVNMTSLSRNIEIDLRQMLGETDTPPAIKPVDGLLM